MPRDIDWHAGSEGLRQKVYLSGERRLDIKTDDDGMTIELFEDGMFVGMESATYEEIAEGLQED